MVAATGLIGKLVLDSVVFLGALKLVLIPESVAPWDARSLYRVRCGGGPVVPYEFGLMTTIGKPTWKGVWEFCTCRSSTDTRLMASPDSSPVWADYRRTPENSLRMKLADRAETNTGVVKIESQQQELSEGDRSDLATVATSALRVVDPGEPGAG